ncbi:unnamed protein product, partial [marine sediment metagenome]
MFCREYGPESAMSTCHLYFVRAKKPSMVSLNARISFRLAENILKYMG